MKRTRTFALATVLLFAAVSLLLLTKDARSTQQTSSLNAPRNVNLKNSFTLNQANSWQVTSGAVSSNQNNLRSPSFPDKNYIISDVHVGVNYCFPDSYSNNQCIKVLIHTSGAQVLGQFVLNEANQTGALHYTTGIPVIKAASIYATLTGVNFSAPQTATVTVIVNGFDIP